MQLPPPLRTTRLAVVLAAIPVLALTLGIPLANRLEPRLFGLPFLLVYIVAWILLTPAFLAGAYAADRAAAEERRVHDAAEVRRTHPADEGRLQ